MKYQAYKNRSIDFNKQVKIYKNLHNGLFSVIQNKLVVAYIESFTLNNVVFKVNESGRQRVIKEKKKNVHAFICGLLVDVNNIRDSLEYTFNDLRKERWVMYNPYKNSSFMKSVNSKVYDLKNNHVHKNMTLHGHSKLGLTFINQ